MSKFAISDGRLDLLSVTTTSDRSGECQVYINVRDGSGVHISRHAGRTHMRQGKQLPRGVHYRVPLSNVTNEVLARLVRRPEGGFELGLPDSPSSAVSWSFETVKPSKGRRPTYPIPGDLTELLVVGPSYVSDYANETRLPVASNPLPILGPLPEPDRGIRPLRIALLLRSSSVPSSSWASMRSL